MINYKQILQNFIGFNDKMVFKVARVLYFCVCVPEA